MKSCKKQKFVGDAQEEIDFLFVGKFTVDRMRNFDYMFLLADDVCLSSLRSLRLE